MSQQQPDISKDLQKRAFAPDIALQVALAQLGVLREEERCALINHLEQKRDSLAKSPLLAGLVDPPSQAPHRTRTHRARRVTDRERRLSAEHARKRKRIIRRATPAWANLEAIAAIYEKARRKTLRTGIPHCVDHEIPLQGRNVCGLHVETNLRVITVRANSAKHNHHRSE